MRYLATTSDLQVVRGYNSKLTRKWEAENGKNRTAKVFVVLEEEPTGGFGEFSREEALRNPGIASMVILNNADFTGRKPESEVPVLVRVSLDEIKSFTEAELNQPVTYLVDLDNAQSGWDFIWARDLSRTYGVRFTNGILPAIDGLLIGLFDKEGIEKNSGDGYKGVAWDSFDDAELVPLESITGLVEAAAPKPRTRKAPKVKPLQELFDEDEDDAPKKPVKRTPTRASRKSSFLDSMF